MARSDWAALLTEPAAEYVAQIELQRFGLNPYLPQLRKRQHTRAGQYVMRHYPLFARYILIPINQAHVPTIRMARGINRATPLLTGENGRPWRAPQKIIDAIKQAEQEGQFDEILHKGDDVTLAYGVLATVRSVLTETPCNGMVELLSPLLGGSKVRVDQSKIVRA